jgi:hypothetical protein
MKTFQGQMIEDPTVPLLYVPLGENELANVLVDYSNDWQESLIFISRLAASHGMGVNVHGIEQRVRNLIGEV